MDARPVHEEKRKDSTWHFWTGPAVNPASVAVVAAQPPAAAPPESGVPVDATLTRPSRAPTPSSFCSAADCSGTCQTALLTDINAEDNNVLPGYLGYQSMH
ncbi:hypothetical protein J3R82DRAFT_1916 [Butyriboletus roseoflavus]|nr:hypothetical protein J3R82DRAFT_1916 [Butyriboletus roseoflavus]